MSNVKKHPRSNPELIVVARTEAGIRSEGLAVRSAAGAKVSSLNSILKSAKVSLRPLFDVSEERAQSTMGPALQRARMADSVPDVSTFYIVEGAAKNLGKLAEDLLSEGTIEAAYVKPGGEPPEWYDAVIGVPPDVQINFSPAPTSDFNARQGYLDAAPAGVDARFGWTKPGGRGDGIRVIDLEWGWNFSHEDLLQNQGGIVGGTGAADTDHGTCVIGEISGDHNGLGIMGIAPNATIMAVAFSMASATAIRMAADRLGAGDVILLEIHRPGPRFNFQARNDQRGYIAIEWWPDDFAAISYAIAKGIIVVEAAGNGAENIDDAIYSTRPTGFPASWSNPFNRSNSQCGAIICGAGAPPPGTHGRNHGADRSRLDFSNFGACVDAQGWGREVTTTGRSWGSADLYNGGANAWYTDQFSGTSSASPIVTGVAAVVQGMLRAGGKPLLTSVKLRDLLRATGSPQQDEPGRPATQRIGNRPNLRAIQAQLFPKSIIKDSKDIKEARKEKIETKDRKDSIKDKVEVKEQKELKEQVKEKAEVKEIKEKERKEFKELKEIKEIEKQPKEIQEGKGIHETGSGIGGGLGGGPSAGIAVDERLAALEEQVAALTHFIEAGLRPDLSMSALSDEKSLADQLSGDDRSAKNAKDAKDVEKLSDT